MKACALFLMISVAMWTHPLLAQTFEASNANPPMWTNVTPGPPGRAYHASAFDEVRQRTLIFGGRGGYNPTSTLGDTWEWNGESWSQIAAVGPSPRSGHAMVYDSSRKRIVLFGGSLSNGSASRETWEWDGSEWHLASTKGPSPRRLLAMAFDAARSRVVLFGGAISLSSDVLDDNTTWEWDGTSWAAVSSSGPHPRIGNSMAYDPIRQKVVLFGGFYNGVAQTVRLGDTWEWDGSTWSQVANTGPSPRHGHSMAYDPSLQKIMLFGGSGPGVQADYWAWDGAAWFQYSNWGPKSCYLHSLVYDAHVGSMVLFGGIASHSGISSYLADTWEWLNSSWTLIQSSGPLRRNNHAMVYDSIREKVVMFGGADGGPYFQDTWEWDGTIWNEMATSGPERRTNHAMAFDTLNGETVLFGGYSDNPYGFPADTFTWNGVEWTRRSVGGPSPRYGHAMAYDSLRNRVVLFGGSRFSLTGGPTLFFGDTWEWDGNSWMMITSVGPSARFDHSMAYDPIRRKTVLFGGGVPPESNLETWEWDGVRWTQMDTIGPPASGPMAYMASRERTVLFQGYALNINQPETWEWDGRRWMKQLVRGPRTLFGNALAYDEVHREIVLFGGTVNGQPHPDTWIYSNMEKSLVDSTE